MAPKGALVELSDAEKDLIKARQEKLERADPSVLEEVDFVVCAPVPSGENIVEPTKCCRCGTSLVISPKSPKKPPRICMDCVIKLPNGPRSKAN